jgi:hypothetical protein
MQLTLKHRLNSRASQAQELKRHLAFPCDQYGAALETRLCNRSRHGQLERRGGR